MTNAVFPSITLTDTEMDLIHSLLCDPLLQKYFVMLARQNAEDIVRGGSREGESAESYLRREALIKGRIEALSTLLSVDPAIPKIS